VGWVIRDGLIAVCGELFTGKLSTATGHAECIIDRLYYQGRGFSLGDPYQKGKNRKRKTANECVGWAIRDGVIAICGQAFAPTKSDDELHDPQCGRNRSYWPSIGYKLGDSVRRKCAFRKCTEPPFDRIKRSKTREYFCSPKHAAREFAARKEDRLAAAKHEAEELRKRIAELGTQPAKKPGPTKKPAENKRPFQTGAAVELEIPIFAQLFAAKQSLPETTKRNDLKLEANLRSSGFSSERIAAALRSQNPTIAARRFVANRSLNSEQSLSFDVVAKYHRAYRTMRQP
jgi:hypothetical protein